MRKIVCLISLLLIAGCASRQEMLDSVDDEIETTEENASNIQKQLRKQTGPDGVNIKKDLFITTGNRSLNRSKTVPPSMKQYVDLVVTPEASIERILDELSRTTGETVRLSQRLIDGDNDESDPVYKQHIIDYHGPLRGVLDDIATKTGTYWEITDGDIRFFRIKSKTFQVAAYPGQASITSEQAGIGQASGDEGGSGGGDGGSSSGGEGSSLSTELQSDEMNIWDDVSTNLTTFLGENGKISVNPSASQITVTDNPRNLRNVEEYVKTINRQFSRQVTINMQLVSIRLSESVERGFQADFVMSDVISDIQTNLSSQNINLTTGSGFFSINVPPSANSDLSGSELVLRALRQQGNVSVTAQNTKRTFHNHPTSFRDVEQVSYIEESTVNQTENSTSTEIQQGKVQTGFSFHVRPFVKDNSNIMLDYGMGFSVLEDLVRKSAGTTTVESPEVSRTNDIQRTIIEPNSTVVVTGFREDESFKDYDGGYFSGYGEIGEKSSRVFLLMMTPTLQSL